MEAFILHIAEDPQAKESVVAAVGGNKPFLKPADVSVRAHQERIAVLCHYVNLLLGTRGELSPAESRIFFSTLSQRPGEMPLGNLLMMSPPAAPKPSKNG